LGVLFLGDHFHYYFNMIESAIYRALTPANLPAVSVNLLKADVSIDFHRVQKFIRSKIAIPCNFIGKISNDFKFPVISDS